MAKPPVDWEAVEREFRAGQLSTREIGRQHGVSHVAINKRAKADGWTRNLAQRVREEVTNRLVTSEVTSGDPVTERQAIGLAAQRGVVIVREHRTTIGKARSIVELLMDELEGATIGIDEIEEAIAEETASDLNGQRRARMLKAVNLSTRAGVITNLAAALKTLVGLERQVFSLDDSPASDGDRRTIERVEYIVVDVTPTDTAGIPAITSPEEVQGG